jgi:hypothetical protein
MQTQIYQPVAGETAEPSSLPCKITSKTIEPILSAIKDYATSQTRLMIFVGQTSPSGFTASISAIPEEEPPIALTSS